MIIEEVAAPAISLAEAQAFARVETGEEEALLAALVRSASALCEAFTGQALIVREFREDLPASGAWQRLGRTPVRAIDTVAAIAPDGSTTPLPAGAYGIDIDASGDGWVRVIDAGGATRVEVRASAGIGGNANELPEPLRHGIVRLVGHMYASRDGGGGGEPPAAVTALWRPFRRMRIA